MFGNIHSSRLDVRLMAYRRSIIASNFQLSKNVFQLRRSEIGVGYGLVSHRNLSSASGGRRVPFKIEVLNNPEVLNGMVGVVGDKAVNEVAVAAENSFPPVAAFQYLVDYVHCYTGFNWWASIVVTTLLYRFIQLPLHIHREIFISKYSETNLRQLFSTFEKSLKNLDDPSGREEGLAIKNQVVKVSKISLLGHAILIAFNCCFFFVILNMAEKVPSFITGGTLWFTDLTTSDRIRLPILLGLTVWMNFKYKAINLLALAFVGAATAGFPNAMYCYGITSNLFSIAFSTVVANPQVQKLLGMSLIIQPSTAKNPSEASSKPAASSSVTDQRLRKGERGFKGKK